MGANDAVTPLDNELVADFDRLDPLRGHGTAAAQNLENFVRLEHKAGGSDREREAKTIAI
ncbi:oxygen-dependent choline dehydrogenase [Methylorubrum populi]|uniref:Oxygen-dependent choline dehydrogenase n=1 Tax=Methylorubrum populi TaxID=223967 RepID=A0A160PGD7_9HYPH|nr:oxygen-dependent choline dehydrogenase [Methylorubrum populi]